MSDTQPGPIDFPIAVDGDLQQLAGEDLVRAQLELRELTDVGVAVTKMQILPGPALRYHISFPKDEAMWRVRDRIEAKLFDVGQTMQGGMLAFYATKRITRSRGWSE